MNKGSFVSRIERWLPILQWGRSYGRESAVNDLVAAVIVTIMLIPQSLAYALLAGLPPEVGLYASILPLVAYAVFGTSRALAVGPVAVVSLMTAAAVGQVAAQGTADYLSAAIVLALLSGLFLILMGAVPPRLSRELPEPPGDLRLHHRLGPDHRRQPAQAHPRHSRAGA